MKLFILISLLIFFGCDHNSIEPYSSKTLSWAYEGSPNYHCYYTNDIRCEGTYDGQHHSYKFESINLIDIIDGYYIVEVCDYINPSTIQLDQNPCFENGFYWESNEDICYEYTLTEQFSSGCYLINGVSNIQYEGE